MHSRVFTALLRSIRFMQKPPVRRVFILLALIGQFFCYGFGSIEEALELLPSHDFFVWLASYALIVALVSIVLFARTPKQMAWEFLCATFPIPLCVFIFLSLSQLVSAASDIYHGAFVAHFSDYLQNLFVIPESAVMLWFKSFILIFWMPLTAAAGLRIAAHLIMRLRRVRSQPSPISIDSAA